MPSHAFHRAVERLVFGRDFPEVHEALDAPGRVLGPLHRVVGHDPLTALRAKDPRPVLLHHLLDWGTLPLLPLALLVDPDAVREAPALLRAPLEHLPRLKVPAPPRLRIRF